ncbi:hydrolase [Sphaerisporangium rufum]|uniref:Hydrolase n=1 Tax=Sphaerisporangium rufum TaxID=1381558 RepID=A0A919R7D7_9ACTN|nr:alpha/beta fold hydrolase [Sphaerisporangium rufum]GII79771.1 hydrolase [Sphaerisporangium rufum]
MRLAYERRGDGPALVLLHGIGHHWQAWEPVLDLLAASRDVVAVDLPGFGASPPLPAGTPYDPWTLADTVESFCAGLGLREPHIAGNSLGGYIALTLAARGVVRSATALSPAGFWTAAELAWADAVLRGLRGVARGLPAGRAAALARSATGRRLAMGLLVARPERMTPEGVLAGAAALGAAAGFDETLRSFREAGPPPAPKAPVTIAWGEHDRLLLRRQAVRAARWADRPVKLLRGCGHVPMGDDPELVARVILDGSR